MKKNKGDKTIQVIIHRYMKMSQGNSLCTYLKQAKTSSFFPLQNHRTGGQNRSCLGEEGLAPMGGGGARERVQEGEYGANTAYSCM
jgi:hypothetical protein